MPENQVTIPAPPAWHWLSRELLVLGVLLPAIAAFLDQYLLGMCQAGSNRDVMIPLTFAVFVIQIRILSGLVGTRVKTRPYWWVVFA